MALLQVDVVMGLVVIWQMLVLPLGEDDDLPSAARPSRVAERRDGLLAHDAVRATHRVLDTDIERGDRLASGALDDGLQLTPGQSQDGCHATVAFRVFHCEGLHIQEPPHHPSGGPHALSGVSERARENQCIASATIFAKDRERRENFSWVQGQGGTTRRMPLHR